MLAPWYLLLGQFSVTFEYRLGSQHANADGMSRQCGQYQRPDCPVSAMDLPVPDTDPETEMVDQPFAASEIGESMDADLLPESSGETWVASALIEEFTADLLPAGSNVDLITESHLSPKFRCWWLQVGNLSIDTDGRLWQRRASSAEGSQLVVPRNELRAMIRRFHDSLFARHLGISRTVFRLQTRVYWPGLRNDVRTYVALCTVCIARKSPRKTSRACILCRSKTH